MEPTLDTEAIPNDVDRLATSFDHHDPALDHAVLLQVYERLLDGDPVPWAEAHGGFHMVTRFDDVIDVERRASVFSSAAGVLHPKLEGRPPTIPIEYDGPAHAAYRALFMDLLSAPRVRSIEPYLRDLTDRVLSAYRASGSDDFVHGVAGQIPVRAIGFLLGWGEEASDDIQAFATNILEHAGTPQMMTAVQALSESMLAELHRRRESPVDDYTSRLVHRDFEGRKLDDAELLSIIQTFVFAGYETTANTMASLVHHFATHPEDQERVRTDAAARVNAIEEGLRLFPPVHTMFRTATCPTSIGDVAVAEGDRVALLYGPANRDADRFSCPHEFQIDRPDARHHLSFGIGPHFCAGAPLARAELRILLEALSELPPYELAGDVEHFPRLMMGQMMGLRRLPLRFAEPTAS
jgi:cytochrome P450